MKIDYDLVAKITNALASVDPVGKPMDLPVFVEEIGPLTIQDTLYLLIKTHGTPTILALAPDYYGLGSRYDTKGELEFAVLDFGVIPPVVRWTKTPMDILGSDDLNRMDGPEFV
jgi:hypothetical protein